MATKITGYKAVFGNEFIKGWFVDLDKKVENRIVYMFKEIKEIIEELNIDSVVIESIPLKGGLSVTLALAQLRGAIICHCVTNNIQWVDVNPVAWEKHYWEKTIDKTEEDQKEFDNLVIYDKKTKKYKNDTKEKTLWIYNKKHETDLEQDCRIKVDMQLATNKITLKEKARLLQKGHACWYDVADCDGLWQYVKDKRIIRR